MNYINWSLLIEEDYMKMVHVQ